MSRTRDQQRFTISEVATDWHEPMVPQRIMWPSIAHANGQLDHGAASRHIIAPISHTRPSPTAAPACAIYIKQSTVNVYKIDSGYDQEYGLVSVFR